MVEITVQLVEKLIQSQFPEWSHLPVDPVERQGNDNRTFRLGKEMGIRLPSAERYVPQVEKEYYWLPILKEYIDLSISLPLAKGNPGEGYPWVWSINQWIAGDTASISNVKDLNRFALDLALFLKQLQSIASSEGPRAGQHNFFRGGSISVYDKETKTVIQNTKSKFDETTASEIWNKALQSQWKERPVWVHGDIAPGNLLVNREGILSGVIDFGILGVGDPSCDLAMAWTFFDDESRRVFKKTMDLDEGTWNRGRGWALWKALITYDYFYREDQERAAEMERVIDNIFREFRVGV
jgi:aminoglycoside phosphotransferase (APT) family kinase protein